MNRPRNLYLLVLMIALVPAAAWAEELPARGPIPFTAFDKDKNGSISSEEFYAVRGERMSQRAAEGRPMRGAANAPSFEQFDSDKNGLLSQAELQTGQQAQMQNRQGQGSQGGQGMGGQGMGGQGMGGGQGRGAGKGAGANRPSFGEYDLNGDGKLTEQEFNDARAKRQSERAQQGGQMRNAPNAPGFADLDTNGDGAISAEEFAAPQAAQRGGRP